MNDARAQLEAAARRREERENYLRMVVDLQDDLLQTAMQEYAFSLRLEGMLAAA